MIKFERQINLSVLFKSFQVKGLSKLVLTGIFRLSFNLVEDSFQFPMIIAQNGWKENFQSI